MYTSSRFCRRLHVHCIVLSRLGDGKLSPDWGMENCLSASLTKKRWAVLLPFCKTFKRFLSSLILINFNKPNNTVHFIFTPKIRNALLSVMRVCHTTDLLRLHVTEYRQVISGHLQFQPPPHSSVVSKVSHYPKETEITVNEKKVYIFYLLALS